MTAPRGNRRNNRRESATYEQMRQIVEQLQTAADLMTTASVASEGVAKSAEKIFTNTERLVEMMVAQAQQAQASGQYGPVIGGTQTPGWGFNRPTMPGYQAMGGYGAQGAYPGPGNPAFGSSGHGFGSHGSGFGAPSGSLGSLQQLAASAINNRWGLNAGGGPGQQISYSQNANGGYNVHVNGGAPVSTISARQYQNRQLVSRVSGSMGQGGIMAGLGQLPVVGQAMNAANDLYRFGQFVGDQRSANAQYQSIYGPGTSGWDERMHNFGGRFRNWANNIGSVFGLSSGGLSDRDYDKTFKGVSAMGFNGRDRNQMIGFAQNNFNAMGMSVDESLQLIGVNAKTASTSLSTLTDQLTNVSKMAQEAGQNADVFRQKFIASYTTAVNAGFGAGSGALATANTAVTAGQGRMFAGMDTSSMYGTIGGQQMMASAGGYQSVAQFSFAAQQNPAVVGNVQQKLVNMQLGQAATPEATQYAQQLIREAGGQTHVQANQNVAERIAGQVIARFPNGVNPYVILNGLKAIGVTGIDESNVPGLVTYWVQWLASKGTNITSQIAKVQQANDQANITTGKNTQNIVDKNQVGRDTVTKGNSGSTYTSGNTTLYDPVIAKMEKDKIAHVEVQTAKGARLVSLEDAAKYYRDQLVKGTAILESGPHAGESVGSVYGTETSAHYKSTVDSKVEKGTDYDKTVGQYQNLSQSDNKLLQRIGRDSLKTLGVAPTGGSGVNGSVVISMTPELAKYLKINLSGSGLVDSAAAANAPPSLPSTGASTGPR